MKLLKLLALTVLLNIGCGGIHYVPAPPIPPSYPLKPIAVITGTPGAGSLVTLLDTRGHGDITLKSTSDATGYAGFPEVSATLDATHLTITQAGCKPYDQWVKLSEVAPHNQVFITLDCDVDPSGIPLTQIAAIRGAMWPTAVNCPGLLLPFGPRPGQPTNIIATVFITNYTHQQQLDAIACIKSQGWTHVVMGPLVDSDGYHGQYTPNDWRGVRWDQFLDALQLFWNNQLTPVVFIHPDGWTFEQTRDAFTDMLSQPRAQRLIRIVVPHGWEPCKYECSSYTWAAYGQWARQTLPNALVLLHTVADVDAPVGTDARGDDNGHPNAEGWARVVPFYHGWLVQNAAFECPTCIAPNGRTNFQNFQDQFNPAIRGSYIDRFHNGYAGWPRFSAWGSDQPLRIYAGEYRSYWTYWQNRPEAEGLAWGDAAIKAGADGALDGLTVSVPVR